MKKISALVCAFSLLGGIAFTAPASAQGYPNKTVKVLVGYTPGS
jgi:tripartite-type tricarboxylate transporter receptor subunit TctC